MATKKTISNSFVVNTIEDGERGKVGRFFYYAGDFDANNADKKFLVNDAQAPFFRHKNKGTEIYYYYVFNPEVNGEYTMSEMWEESVSSFNNKPWEIMTNDFKYLITEALFSENAHLGSAIIKGDWMISQWGKIDGNHSEEFTAFDPDFPNSNNEGKTNFIPNYAVDLRKGVSYQNEAYLTGSLFANSIQTNFVDIPAHIYNNNSIPEDYYLGMDEETGAVKPLGVWNFRIVHPIGSTNTSKTIILPVDQYAYYGQRVIIYNPPPYYGDFTTKVIGGDVTIQPAILGEFDQDKKCWFPSTHNVYLSGLSKAPKSGDINNPVIYEGYLPVSSLTFGNGVVELMCVPSINGEDGCDWCVVNLGTNYYYVN